MKKVLVIGSGGAGKSTFAKRLSEKTGLEVIHLDQLYWQPNWVETPKDEWQEIVKEIIEGDEWILDGNFGGTMEMRIEACDTVIFLEMPRTVCVYRILYLLGNGLRKLCCDYLAKSVIPSLNFSQTIFCLV